MGSAFLYDRKLRPIIQKNAPRGPHCGGIELCRKYDPPQAENPAAQDSFCRFCMRNKYGIMSAGDKEN